MYTRFRQRFFWVALIGSANLAFMIKFNNKLPCEAASAPPAASFRFEGRHPELFILFE
jgi:hypothetical protein